MDCSLTDGQEGYLLQTETKIPIIAAWNPNDFEMSYHRNNKEQMMMYIKDSGKIRVRDYDTKISVYVWHGLMMYICWSILSLV